MPQLEISTYSSQIFWLIVSFSLMLIMMRFVIVPKISSIIDKRNRYIENYINKAEKLQKEALISLEKYNSAIDKAKKSADDKAKEAQKELEEFIALKSQETAEKLNAKIAENEKILAEQRELALKESYVAAENLTAVILKKVGLEDIVPAKNATEDNQKENANNG